MSYLTEKTTYRPEIDGLRAFAVLSVVAFHAFPELIRGGFIGVDIFFVISGFLITSHIFENLDKGQFNLPEFFARRIRRIFPALIVVLASALGFGWFVLLADEYAQLGKHILSGTTFVINFVLAEEIGYFDNAAETKPMLHLWSLAVEEQFYVLWPVVLLLAWKRQINLLTVTVVVAAVSFGLNLYFVESDPAETFFWPIGRFWELLAGSCFAWFVLYRSNYLSHSSGHINQILGSSNFVSFIGLALLVSSVTFMHAELAVPSAWTLIPISGTMLIILSGSKGLLTRLFLMNPVAIWVGLISYPLYLWHWPILSFLQIIEGGAPHYGVRVTAILFSVLLAWLTYKLVESPIRKQVVAAPKVMHLVTCMVGLGLFAGVVSYSNGVKDRSVVTKYNMNLSELKRTVAKEDQCLSFLGLSESKFNYCKIGKLGTEGVVAVIGDSHAHVAFPGIARGLETFGYTSVLLANSSCPPFYNFPEGRADKHRTHCAERTMEILSLVSNIKKLNRVIIFSRGPTYWTGTEPSVSGKKDPSISMDDYFKGLQSTINFIQKRGVEVLYVTENPELKYHARSCLPRPFNAKSKNKCNQNLEVVLARQKAYRENLMALDNVIVVDSLTAFCREQSEICFAVNKKNELLYADADHLSVIGSVWQYENLLKAYFQRD
jgi:peptidoglycan/LPS O-acetylase OafA/YrhL